jgi:hypothetical protein
MINVSPSKALLLCYILSWMHCIEACDVGFTGTGCNVCDIGFTGSQCQECTSDRFGRTCEACASCVHGDCQAKRVGICNCRYCYEGATCAQQVEGSYCQVYLLFTNPLIIFLFVLGAVMVGGIVCVPLVWIWINCCKKTTKRKPGF